MIKLSLLLTFVLFVYVESFAVHARYAGVIEKNIPMGLTLQNAILAANRFLGFCIAPQLGYLVDTGADINEIIKLAFIAFFLAGLFTYLSYKKNAHIFSRFRGVIYHVTRNEYSLISFFRFHEGFEEPLNRYEHDNIDLKIFLASTLISATYYGVSFYLAIIASENFSFRGTILQLSGIVTGLGSLLLNFYVYPRLTQMETNASHIIGYRSLLLGKIVGVSLLPMIILSIIMVLA